MAAKRKSRTATKNPMQRNHTDEETEALLVYGWRGRVDFDIDGKLEALGGALEGTDAVYVIAQDLVNGDGVMPTVFGRAAARAHADKGPREVDMKVVRAIEGRGAPLAHDARERVKALAMRGFGKGPARWYVVPTGCLATGYLAFGELVKRKPDDDDAKLWFGQDMGQRVHKKVVRGELVALASDWDVVTADLSPSADRARRKKNASGAYYLLASYD